MTTLRLTDVSVYVNRVCGDPAFPVSITLRGCTDGRPHELHLTEAELSALAQALDVLMSAPRVIAIERHVEHGSR